MQPGGHEHVHGARLLKLRAQIRGQLAALAPQFAGDDRCRRFAKMQLQRRVRALAQASKPRAPRAVISQDCDEGCARDTRANPAFAFNRALACLAGIAYVVERLEPSTYDCARTRRKPLAQREQCERSDVDRKRVGRTRGVGSARIEDRPAPARHP